MLAIKAWPKYLFKALIYTLPALLVAVISIFMYSDLMSECHVSNVLQKQMRARLSKTELQSARPSPGICPTSFFYKGDDGIEHCAMGFENIFRGPEIDFGSCD